MQLGLWRCREPKCCALKPGEFEAGYFHLARKAWARVLISTRFLMKAFQLLWLVRLFAVLLLVFFLGIQAGAEWYAQPCWGQELPGPTPPLPEVVGGDLSQSESAAGVCWGPTLENPSSTALPSSQPDAMPGRHCGHSCWLPFQGFVYRCL